MLLVVGAWARAYRDPEFDENAWVCLRREAVILRVVVRLMNPTLGCKDLMWPDNCLVFSVILFNQLCNCIDMHTCNRPSTWPKKKVAPNCHHRVLAERLIAQITSTAEKLVRVLRLVCAIQTLMSFKHSEARRFTFTVCARALSPDMKRLVEREQSRQTHTLRYSTCRCRAQIEP